MKEFNYTLSEGIFKGLRRFSHDSDNLVECHNLAPAEGGLDLHDYITSMNESASFGGTGFVTPSTATRTITLNVSDFVDSSDVATATVYIDAVNKGTTDANGDITITGVEVGGHALKITKTGYTDSDADDLYNDFIMVI